MSTRFGKFEMIRRIRRPEHHAVELGPGAPKCFLRHLGPRSRLTRLTLPACDRPQASPLSQDLSLAEAEKNVHRHFRKRPIDSRPPRLGIKGAAKYTCARQDHRQHNTSSALESSHVVFAEPREDEARCSCKKSMVHPSSPTPSRSSLLSVMVSARATVAQLYDLGCAFAARLEIDQLIHS